MKIIGIDPGLNKTGWSVISILDRKLSFIASGLIKTSPQDKLDTRLTIIYRGLKEVINLYSPHECAVEETFVNKNALSSLKLGHARGAIIVAASSMGLPVFEYAANLIKKTVVGTGHADKNQVAVMVKYLLPKVKCSSEDEFDACAIAICHLNHAKSREIIK